MNAQDDLTIPQIVAEAFDNSKAHGFHDRPASFGDRIALIHSELSEALEEFRNGHEPAEVYFGPGNKPEGVPIELADVVIRIADLCGTYGIDLEAALHVKLAYNRTRPHRHGGKVL